MQLDYSILSVPAGLFSAKIEITLVTDQKIYQYNISDQLLIKYPCWLQQTKAKKKIDQ